MFRKALPDDVPRINEMIAAAELPAAFVLEFLEGFIVAERDRRVVACGGIETYGACAVIRSVVVEPDARGVGIGREIAERLVEAAREEGATDLYLFTAEALTFWTLLGFVEVGYEEWKESARASWQYQFLSRNREAVRDVHTMWRRLDR